MPKYHFELELYVNNKKDPKSMTYIEDLNKICDSYLPDYKTRIKIIDIDKSPEVAVKKQIIAIPTVVVNVPPPMRKYFGSYHNLRVTLDKHHQGFEQLKKLKPQKVAKGDK